MAKNSKELRLVYEAYQRLIKAAEDIVQLEDETGIPARKILSKGYRQGLQRGLDSLMYCSEEEPTLSPSSRGEK